MDFPWYKLNIYISLAYMLFATLNMNRWCNFTPPPPPRKQSGYFFQELITHTLQSPAYFDGEQRSEDDQHVRTTYNPVLLI